MNVLRKRPFRLLFVGQAVSQFGDALYALIFLFMVDKLTGRAEYVGIVGILQTLPFLLFSPIAGVFADRHDRRGIMMFADISSTIILAIFAVIVYNDPKPETWMIFLTAALLSSVNAFFMPAKSAAIPNLVPPDKLQEANGISAATQHLMPLIGLGISGAVLGAIYLQNPSMFFFLAVILNLVTFAYSAVCISMLPSIKPDREKHERMGVLHEAKEGFMVISMDPVLRVLFLLSIVVNLMISPFMVVYVAVNRAWFGGNFTTLAIAEFSFAFGLVVSSLLASKTKVTRVGMANIICLTLVGLAIAAMGLSKNYFAFIAWNLLCGLLLPIANVPMVTYFQLAVPDHLRGRVNSLLTMVAMGAMPIGMGLAGSLLTKIGLVNMFFLMGFGMAVPAALTVLNKDFRRARLPESREISAESA